MKWWICCLTAGAVIGMLGCGNINMPESYEDDSVRQEEEQPAAEPEAEQGNVAAGTEKTEQENVAAGTEKTEQGKVVAGTEETGQRDVAAGTGETEQGNAAVGAEETEQGNTATKTEKTEDMDLNLAFTLVTGDTTMEGLSQEVVNQISAINAGEPPAEVIGAEELEGYYALVATYTIVGKDKTSGEEARGNGRLTLYIPNLLEGLDEISFLFYDRAEDTWRIIPAEKVDTAARTVSAILPGSGTLTVIYRRE